MADQLDRSKELLSVGKVVKAQGIKGEIKIAPFSGVAEDLLPYKEFVLSSGTGPESFTVSKSRVQGKSFILKIDSVNDRDTSEKFVGREVFVAKDDMPVLSDDEFYWHDFIGLQVVTDQGAALGTVSSLMATGANDILVISGKGKEYLVPATDEILVEVNWEAKTVVIAPIPGLLEINDPDAV